MPQLPTRRRTLLIDFDGVIHTTHGEITELPTGLPIGKARAAIWQLERSYRLVIFTTRPPEGVERWLQKYGFPKMKVTRTKEPAHLIIDDRAIQFEGVWNDEYLSRITSFSPHWRLNAPEPETAELSEELDLPQDPRQEST